jgi:glycosyltransferase involved in cell wall biosynthesis
MSDVAPAISIVTATRQRSGRLAEYVASIEAQRIAVPFELVLVDDASTDATWDEILHLALSSSVPITPIRRTERGGPGGARNTGWRAARAPLIAFTDDDCTPTPEWLATIHRALQEADLVQGRTLPRADQVAAGGPFGRTLRVEEEGLYPTCNMGYRRSVLEAVGGFDEHYTLTCEDTDLAWRSRENGATTRWEPDALVHHDVHPGRFALLLKDKVRWDGVALVVRDHPPLRSHLHRRVFWKPSHPPALLAAAGAAVAERSLTHWRGGKRVAGLVAASALMAPYVRFRTKVAPLPAGPRRRVALIPAVLVADWVEVGVMVAASAKHRSIVL